MNLAGLYPLTIDQNLACGGVTAKVAINGGYRSSGGELTPDVVQQINAHRRTCQTKARRILVGSALTGALIACAGAPLVTRVPRRPSR